MESSIEIDNVKSGNEEGVGTRALKKSGSLGIARTSTQCLDKSMVAEVEKATQSLEHMMEARLKKSVPPGRRAERMKTLSSSRSKCSKTVLRGVLAR